MTPEDELQAPVAQVRKLCCDSELIIPYEIPRISRKPVDCTPKITYSDPFQTKPDTPPELLALVRRIRRKERSRCEYKRSFLFNYRNSVKERQNRPTNEQKQARIKLAYVRNKNRPGRINAKTQIKAGKIIYNN